MQSHCERTGLFCLSLDSLLDNWLGYVRVAPMLLVAKREFLLAQRVQAAAHDCSSTAFYFIT